MSSQPTTTPALSERLQAVTEALAAARTQEDVFEIVLTPALEAMSAIAGVVMLVDETGERLTMAARKGYEAGRQTLWQDGPLDGSVPAADALAQYRPLFFEQQGDLIWAYPQLEAQTGGVAAVATAVLPMFLDDQPLGALILDFTLPHQFTPEEQRFLQTLAAQCAIAVGRAQLLHNLQCQVLAHTRFLDEERAALDAFVAFSEAVGIETDEIVLAGQALEVLRVRFGDCSGGYYQRDGELWKLRTWTSDVHAQPELLALLRAGVPSEVPSLAALLHSRAPTFTENWSAEDQGVEHSELYGSTAAYPVLVGGEVQGFLSLSLKRIPQWGERDRAIFRAVGRSFDLALERAAATQALAATQRYLKIAAEHAPILLFATDAHGVFTLSEGSLLAKLGLQAGQAVGHSATALFAGEPDLREGRRLNRALAGEQAHDLTHFESKGVTLETWFIPVKNAVGEVTEVVGVSLDVTERLEAQRQIEHTNEELRRSNRELEQFAYIASHDLQAPIRAVTNFAGIIDRRYGDKLDERGRVYLQQIVEGGQHMKRLVDDLLTFSRVHTEQGELLPVDAQTVFDTVARRLHTPEALIIRSDLPVVQADAQQLDQLLQNLISNGLKYCREGVVPEVEVTAQRDGAWWRFAVSDNGIGIEPQYYERIFEIFQRLHGRESYEGTGIGLAVCKKIVERHGGQLWLESTPGQGSTFFFTLLEG
ncbi:ATP-binding protein [Deinococcus sp. QL22]|uniref:ATP-binding protein n=1 Tax=Deinococcus sp. QL22 TaxID=2939437 RepID=UPI002016F631|nr:ATP-binding protein [Deinococcus sp. QL22]UQN08296.1 ATP-binding protein [Deinococcus sp. QL22]